MEINELLEQLKKKTKNELKYIVFKLLEGKKLDYTELSKVYVDYLQDKDYKNRVLITGLAYPLSQYWQDHRKNKEEKIFLKCKTAYNLLKSKVFHTAGIEKDLQKIIDDYDYSEDKNGMHKWMYDKKD